MLSKLAVVLLLSLALALCLTPMALAADQAVAITQSDSVKKIQNAIQTAIDTTGGSGIVNITGSKKGAGETLTLDIPANVSVVWRADYAGDAKTLIELEGPGTFEVAGGTISSGRKGEYAICSDDSDIIVTGDAIVQASGDADSIGWNQSIYPAAIETKSGNITVSGGTVAAIGLRSTAIRTESGDIAITGGKASTSGDGGAAIFAESGEVTVTGGMVEATGTGSSALGCSYGDVKVSGDAIIKSTGNRYYYPYDGGGSMQIPSNAICAWGGGGVIMVSGGTVLATGDGCSAIETSQTDIIISGNAIVQATGDSFIGKDERDPSRAIKCNSGKVTISGGTISATGERGRAIHTDGGDIIVSGGIVSASGKDGLAVFNNYGIVTIRGGMVGGSTAIFALQGGVTAYLAGSCSGAYVYENSGLIVEVASTNVGLVGTTAELTVKTGMGSASWAASGMIEFTLDNDKQYKTQWWGSKKEGDIAPGGFVAFINGFEDNTFRGGNLITREQFVTILFRLKNTQSTALVDKSSPSFKDVAPSRWSYDAIEWARVAGIIAADNAGNFRPAQPLTRAAMAVMLVKADNLTEMAENTFTDLAGHADKDDILRAVRARIFTGYSDGSFKPDGNSTRAEAVTALVRYLLGEEPVDELWQDIELKFNDVTLGIWAYKYIALAVNGYEKLKN
jgi:hypothetical protein